MAPRFPDADVMDYCAADAVLAGQRDAGIVARTDGVDVRLSEFGSRVQLSYRAGAVLHLIRHLFFSGAVAQVAQLIVRAISVQVAALKLRRADESKQNQSVDFAEFHSLAAPQAYDMVATFVESEHSYPTFEQTGVGTMFAVYHSVQRAYLALIRNLVKTLEINYIFPDGHRCTPVAAAASEGLTLHTSALCAEGTV